MPLFGARKKASQMSVPEVRACQSITRRRLPISLMRFSEARGQRRP